jgi:hypothetical protein
VLAKDSSEVDSGLHAFARCLRPCQCNHFLSQSSQGGDGMHGVQACEEQIFSTLSTHAFGSAACAALSVPPAAASASTGYATFLREASWRTAALEGLRSWLTGYVAFLPRTRQKALCHRAADTLSPLLSLLICKESTLPIDSPKTPTDVVLALRALTDGVLSGYLCMPSVHAFTAQWGDIIAACLEPLREGRPWLTPAARRAVHCRLLVPLLTSQDAAVAPYLQCHTDEGFLPVRASGCCLACRGVLACVRVLRWH